MISKYNSTMSFTFTVRTDMHEHLYSYNGDDGTVTGRNIGDPIMYTRRRVDGYLENGDWIVKSLIGSAFPCAGIHARMETTKVFIVGKSQRPGEWVVEMNGDASVTRVKTARLKALTADDDLAFAIVKDIGVLYNTAMEMVRKGYGKL